MAQENTSSTAIIEQMRKEMAALKEQNEALQKQLTRKDIVIEEMSERVAALSAKQLATQGEKREPSLPLSAVPPEPALLAAAALSAEDKGVDEQAQQVKHAYLVDCSSRARDYYGIRKPGSRKDLKNNLKALRLSYHILEELAKRPLNEKHQPLNEADRNLFADTCGMLGRLYTSIWESMFPDEEINYRQAVKYYELAIQAGNTEALGLFVEICEDKEEAVLEYPIEFYRASRLAAEKGDDDGLKGLVFCYKKGIGVEKDLDKAQLLSGLWLKAETIDGKLNQAWMEVLRISAPVVQPVVSAALSPARIVAAPPRSLSTFKANDGEDGGSVSHGQRPE